MPLPGFGPVLVLDDGKGWLRHGVEPAHVPERLAQLLLGGIGAGVGGEVGADDQAVGGRNLVRPNLDGEAGLLDNHALVPVASEQIGDGLGGLAVHFE